jgi:hypothetical protein
LTEQNYILTWVLNNGEEAVIFGIVRDKTFIELKKKNSHSFLAQESQVLILHTLSVAYLLLQVMIISDLSNI